MNKNIVKNKKLKDLKNPIKNEDVLEFSIFCIERLKTKMKLEGPEAYELLTSKTDILNSYIVRHFDVLHTLDEAYIMEDFKSLIERRQYGS